MTSIINGDWKDTGANGGTELMVRRLLSSVPQELLQGVQLYPSRPDQAKAGMKQVLWCHDLSNDPMYGHLHETASSWDAIVFVSHWQRQQFHDKFNLNWDKTYVVENSIEPLEFTSSKEGPIRFVYSSMPNRGLELVVPVFEAITKNYDVHLDVFSSFKLYNQQQNDLGFEPLFEKIENNEKMTNHGTVSNSEIREHLSRSDCFVHPGINRPETSCLCLIEAMSAGLSCVHSSFGALPETSKSLTWMYGSALNAQEHANRLYQRVAQVCHLYDAAGREFMQQAGSVQKQVTDHRHNLTAFKMKWENILKNI